MWSAVDFTAGSSGTAAPPPGRGLIVGATLSRCTLMSTDSPTMDAIHTRFREGAMQIVKGAAVLGFVDYMLE